MVLQFEDAVDELQVRYPTFDFVFLFDHSSGHSKQQIDGLNKLHMNIFFGGRYSAMREMVIEREQGFSCCLTPWKSIAMLATCLTLPWESDSNSDSQKIFGDDTGQ